MMGKGTQDLVAAGVVAIIRASRPLDLVRTAAALAEGGISALEVTLNTPGALDTIAAVRRKLAGRCRVGAGTILCAADVAAAHTAGAEFVVTPTLQLDSIAACRDRGLPIISGCVTPAEMLAAHRAGADLIKLFPATRFGPAFVRDVLGPMPFLRIVPTGGVSAANVADWVKAGAVAVAAGGQLVDPALIAAGAWDELTARARTLVEALHRAQQGSKA
jgi:2-dehydro-3-deoxyphosphogluconate aldolase/(4S)-4-hydroxy-2-oxoglutarate aldolase